MNKFDYLELDWRLKQLYCKYYKIDEEYEIYNEFQCNNCRDTVAMWLTKQGLMIPKQWMHNYNIKNKNGKTLKDLMIENYMPILNKWQDVDKMSIFDKAYFGIIPDIAEHRSDEQDEQGFTVAMLLALNKIQIPKEWQHKPELQNKYGQTVAIIQTQIQQLPDKQWEHDPLIRDKQGNTVAIRLAYNGFIPPKCWYHDSSIQDIYGYTVAMYIIAYCRYIPDDCWNHEPNLQNEYGQTVAMFIPSYCKQIPPKQWYHNPQLKDNDNHTVEDILIYKNFDVPKEWQTNSNKILSDQDKQIIEDYCNYYNIKINYNINQIYKLNKDRNTVAMYLASQKQNIPQQWFHDPNIQNRYNFTVQDYLMANNIDIPYQWQINKDRILTQQEKQYIKNYCEIYNIKVNYNISKYYNFTYDGNTIAMNLAQCYIIPPKIFMHDIYRKNNQNESLYDILYNSLMPIPYHWKDSEMTIFDKACYGEILELKNHKPDEQNEDGNTIAMIYAMLEKAIPKEYYHDPEIQNNDGYTVAMIQAFNRKIPDTQWQHDPSLYSNDGNTVASLLIQYKIIPPKQWCYNPDIFFDNCKSLKEQFYKKDLISPRYLINMSKNKEEIIDYFRNNKIPIPSQYQESNPTIFDQAMLRTIPDINGHKSDEQNEDGFTVAMILAFQNIEVPQQWQHNINIQNEYCQTIFDIYIEKRLVPPQWCCQQPEYQNKYGYTQAMTLALNNITIPKYLYHDPKTQNNDGYTVAMLLAEQEIQPERQWMHSYDIKTNHNISLKYLLQIQNLLIPYHWKEDDMDQFDKTVFDIPVNDKKYDPCEQNQDGYTVAMIQALQGKIPDKQWIHNKYLRFKYKKAYYFMNNFFPQFQINYFTIQNILQSKNINVPKEWKYETLNENENSQAMIDADNGIIPNLGNNDPLYRNIHGNTVAMILAYQGIVPPKEWCHDPLIQNAGDNTVALMLAENEIIPPKYWMHDINLQNNANKSITSLLKDKQLPVPQHWNNNDMSIFDQAIFGIIPDIEGHQPDEQNEDGWTVAMLLALNKMNIPKQWQHDPSLQNKYRYTVAIIQAMNCKIPDKQWQHDKYLRCIYKEVLGIYYYTVQNILQNNNIQIPNEWQYNALNEYEDNQAMIDARKGIIPEIRNNDPLYRNKYGDTVAIILASQGILPPKQWMHDINQTSFMEYSIKSLLIKHNYIYKNQQFIFNYKTQFLDEICQICFNQGKQEFLVTYCDHQICVKCFQKLKNKSINICPICRKQNWVEQIEPQDDISQDDELFE